MYILYVYGSDHQLIISPRGLSSYLSITLSGSTIIPHMEVFDIDVVIRLSFPLTPKQQALFSGHFCNRNLTGVSSRRLWTA